MKEKKYERDLDGEGNERDLDGEGNERKRERHTHREKRQRMIESEREERERIKIGEKETLKAKDNFLKQPF